MFKNWFTKEGSVVVVYDTIEKFPQGCVGYVYKITNTKTGKFYIGKKSLFSNVKKKLTKKELAEHTGPGKKPTKKLVTSESNWLNYWGSNTTLLEEVKQEGTEHFERQILKFCNSKKQLTYWEMHYQCVEEVLLSSRAYNTNILAKFFPEDLIP